MTPTIRGRRLALELRTMRERCGLTQAEAARRCGWSKNKLSRFEDPSTRPSDEDVRALLQMYGVDPDRHQAILNLTKDSWQHGWWTGFRDAFTGNFIMLEDQAPLICSYETMLVPGLLQTPEYARTVIDGARPGTEETDLDRLVAARMARKAILRRSTPPECRFVINEAALRQTVGGEDVMRKQIGDLWSTATSHANVTIQILPFSAAVACGLAGPLTLFIHPSDHGLDTGHTEAQMGEWYAESADEVHGLRLTFDGVCQAALSPEDSTAWLAARTHE
ncbi:hypothetical protein BJF79_03540 [Actinomadura sp. CNU-125]|nr:hypothetical protein BJF79_03540 [Actinomadura sp. CNU-125]